MGGRHVDWLPKSLNEQLESDRMENLIKNRRLDYPDQTNEISS